MFMYVVFKVSNIFKMCCIFAEHINVVYT